MRKTYKPAAPRMALRLIAVAMSVATLALLVVVPAALETAAVDPPAMQQASIAQAHVTAIR